MMKLFTPRAVYDAESRVDAIKRLLSRRSLAASDLLSALDISQPTLSRTIHQIPDAIQFRVSGVRTPRYGIVRRLPGNLSGQHKVFRIDRQGSLAEAGTVCLLAGGETFLQLATSGHLYAGLPPSMAFAAPSGFLGRQTAHAVAAELCLPDSLRDWSDDHRCAYLMARGSNLVGDLVFGEAALAQSMEARALAALSASDKLPAYRAMTSAVKSAAVGSSAGGEQPKFLAFTEDRGHVLVKFAALGTRMAELLRMENLALDCLQGVGVASARTHFLEHAGLTYLEVERFDRVGPHGRVGLLSAGALDDELFGQRDSWSQFAQRCEAARLLNVDQARRIHVMAAYSELIGNSDRHFENISLLLDASGAVADVAPAYDILPMKYAPLGAGVVPDLVPITPKLGPIGVRAGVWGLARRAALTFWERCRDDAALGLSEPMRAVAARNLDAVRQFVAPLVPAHDPSAQAMPAPAAPRKGAKTAHNPH